MAHTSSGAASSRMTSAATKNQAPTLYMYAHKSVTAHTLYVCIYQVGARFLAAAEVILDEAALGVTFSPPFHKIQGCFDGI